MIKRGASRIVSLGHKLVLNFRGRSYFSESKITSRWRRLLVSPFSSLRGVGFKRIGSIALLVGFVIFLVAFLFIDQKVARRLLQSTAINQGQVLSAPVRISAGVTYSPEGIVRYLSARGYLRDTELPSFPGHYSILGDTLHVFTREFIDPQGRTVTPLQASYSFRSHSVTTAGSTSSSFRLEPIVVAHLGGGAIRRAAFRSLQDIPKVVQQAVLATEDKRFYRHWGIDPIGIARALYENMVQGRVAEGGSTLTQQLAKNLVLSPRRTITRKLLEALAALSLELRLTKDQILERYLNEVYFSQEGSVSVHGVGEAAHTFFSKEVRDLSLSQAALLAGMIQAPSAFSPKRNLEKSVERRNVVLSRMVSEGFITDAQRENAKREVIQIKTPKPQSRFAPHFADALERELQNTTISETTTFQSTVHSSLDGELQVCAQRAVDQGLARLKKMHPRLTRGNSRLEHALVALEPSTGLVRAWIGGRDYATNQFDHVSQGLRQIGSTVKAFLYLTAMDESLNSYRVATAMSILADEPTRVHLASSKDWIPENYDKTYHGDVTLRYALERSLNLPAVYVAQRIGLPALSTTIRRLHLAPSVEEVPSLALGALDASLLRLTAAYASLSNGGVYTPPKLYTSTIDLEGYVTTPPSEPDTRVTSEGVAFIMTDILRGVIDRGTATIVRQMGYKGSAAGKTGTSDSARDGWFVGYTPTLVVGVWTGFDDNSKLGLTGGSSAAPTWAYFMNCAAPLLEDLEFKQPPTVKQVTVDTRCIGATTSDTPEEHVVRELFIKGTEPTRVCEDRSIPLNDPKEEEYPDEHRSLDDGDGPFEDVYDRPTSGNTRLSTKIGDLIEEGSEIVRDVLSPRR
jgi:1A family penicillin-binding protein